MRAWNIDGASMMTAPTGGRLASPKVSKKRGMDLGAILGVLNPQPAPPPLDSIPSAPGIVVAALP
jgi:hypothetical protein